MSTTLSATTLKDRIIGFVWQHLMLFASLFVMTFGVALCVRSALGSSVISTIPFVLDLAGQDSKAPGLTIGEWTYIMNFTFVFIQICILRRQFEAVQLFQLLIGFAFGWLLDINMNITSAIETDSLYIQILAQVAGCSILGTGIAFEIRCGSVTMPGEGLPAAISKISGLQFAKAKIYVDISLVAIAVVLGYMFFGHWLWNVVGLGTLLAMVYVGVVVKFISARIRWFDRILYYRPGFRRYIFGLARYIRNITGE